MSNINANPKSLSNFNSSNRSNSGSSSRSTSPRRQLGEREVGLRQNRKTSLLKLLFKCDYVNIGNRIFGYLFSRDVRSLREVCTEMCLSLFESQVFSLSVTPDKLKSIRPHIYPRIYPKAQNANIDQFKPVPVEALVQNASDLQTILKDRRLIVKSVVFKGGLESLRAVGELLPPAVENIEIATEIPSGKKIDLSSYKHLKAIKVRGNPQNILLPKGVTLLNTACGEDLVTTIKKVQPPLPP